MKHTSMHTFTDSHPILVAAVNAVIVLGFVSRLGVGRFLLAQARRFMPD